MKKFWLAAVAIACAACLAGCGSGELRASVSYLAAESEVHSTTAEVVKEVEDTVVEISTESVTTNFGRQYIVSGAGSGVLVGSAEEDYFIVTNNHVIEGAREITVRTHAGKTYSASLVATDDAADIAVVTISSAETLKLAVWGKSDALQIGETVIAIGNPLGNLGGTVTQGILSAAGRQISVGDYTMTLLQTDAAINPGNSGGTVTQGILSAAGRQISVGDYTMTLLQTDAAINPGNSGGGLFNMRGQLIGIVNAKTSKEGIEGLCFAIPADSARASYEDLLTYGYIRGRVTLGLTLAEGTLSVNGTQTVVYVSALGADADENFALYDRILQIGTKEIGSVLDYNDALAALRPGDTVSVKVLRGSLTQGMFSSGITFAATPTEFTVTARQYGA